VKLDLVVYLCIVSVVVLASFADAEDRHLRGDYTLPGFGGNGFGNIVAPPKKDEDDDFVDVLVKPKNEKGMQSMSFMSSGSSGMKLTADIPAAGVQGYQVRAGDLDKLKKNPDVIVEPNHKVYVLDDAPIVEDVIHHIRKLAQTDPWGITAIEASHSFWSELSPPSTIKVCVVDTGYELGHPDLPQSYATGGQTSIGNWDSDPHGHGTAVAGVVAGINNDVGYRGVFGDDKNGKFEIISVKAMAANGGGNEGTALEAVQKCVDLGANVVNLSLGCNDCYTTIGKMAYEKWYQENNLIIFAAAGNSGGNAKSYPASYPAVVSVAMLDTEQKRNLSSQANDQVEIGAPGVSVGSTSINHKYGLKAGTSFASPHAAAAAALVWMYFPNCKNYEIRNALDASALDVEDIGCDEKSGYGMIQAYKAYELLKNDGCAAGGSNILVGGCSQIDRFYSAAPTTAPTVQPDTNNCGATQKVLFELELTTDSYGSETTWDLTGPTTLNGGPYNDKVETHLVEQCIYPGSYTFKINDKFADGMCCKYGNGSYTVKVSGVVKKQGAEFALSEKTDFTATLSASTSSFSTVSNDQVESSPSSCEDTLNFEVEDNGTIYTCADATTRCNECFVKADDPAVCFMDNCCICRESQSD